MDLSYVNELDGPADLEWARATQVRWSRTISTLYTNLEITYLFTLGRWTNPTCLAEKDWNILVCHLQSTPWPKPHPNLLRWRSRKLFQTCVGKGDAVQNASPEIGEWPGPYRNFPKASIWIGFSIINLKTIHCWVAPFVETPIFDSKP